MGRTVTLNDRGILLIGLIILSLTFALGFMANKGKTKEPEITVFSREDLERIAELQQIEEERGSGAEIYAYKDKDGNLMIGWDHDN